MTGNDPTPWYSNFNRDLLGVVAGQGRAMHLQEIAEQMAITGDELKMHHLHVSLGRMTRRGWLERVARGVYRYADGERDFKTYSDRSLPGGT